MAAPYPQDLRVMGVVRMWPIMHVVAALYHFSRFPDPAALKPPLAKLCCQLGVTGTLLLAKEGINGTIAGHRTAIDQVLEHVKGLPGCADLTWKESHANKRPFRKMKVRLKREIVTMGQPDVDPSARVGQYVSAKDWNDFTSDPDVVMIDTRNAYEVAIGSFAGAVNPDTQSFGDFPKWWADNAERFQGKKIAMFCTGGIRCEKSTNYLLGQGVTDVYHLQGGILKYLEDVAENDSTWNGSCFVFDGRVSVGHGLKEGPHILCHGCRRPLDPQDKKRAEYEEGVACHHCVDETSEQDKARFRERQKQIRLATARGDRHL